MNFEFERAVEERKEVVCLLRDSGIAVSEYPPKDIKEVENVNFVMKGGMVQRNNIH